MINNLFDLLDDWRCLPAYQLERRADIFFAIHMPLIFKKHFNEDVIDIIPEFPIRIGTIKKDIPINKSYKIDYTVFTRTNKVYLVELKTDDDSTRDNQDNYYKESIACGFNNILSGVLDINDATSDKYKGKYAYLIDKLIKNGSLTVQNGKIEISNKYNFNKEVVFIIPNEKPLHFASILSFNKIIELLEPEEDALTKRFVKSLIQWKLK
ncbi:MAG: hypothetical protein ACOYO1_18745 [Bacteroidales bacterium]